MVDGTEYASVYSDGKTLELPEDPTKEGYTFSGWYFDDGSFEDKFDKESFGTKTKKPDLYLFAKFEKTEAPDSPTEPDSPSEPESPSEPDSPTEPEEPSSPDEVEKPNGPGSTVTPPSGDDIENGGWID